MYKIVMEKIIEIHFPDQIIHPLNQISIRYNWYLQISGKHWN